MRSSVEWYTVGMLHLRPKVSQRKYRMALDMIHGMTTVMIVETAGFQLPSKRREASSSEDLSGERSLFVIQSLHVATPRYVVIAWRRAPMLTCTQSLHVGSPK